MRLEVQFVPLDPGSRNERVLTLRALLLRGAVRLSRAEGGSERPTADDCSKLQAWPSLNEAGGTA